MSKSKRWMISALETAEAMGAMPLPWQRGQETEPRPEAPELAKSALIFDRPQLGGYDRFFQDLPRHHHWAAQAIVQPIFCVPRLGFARQTLF